MQYLAGKKERREGREEGREGGRRMRRKRKRRKKRHYRGKGGRKTRRSRRTRRKKRREILVRIKKAVAEGQAHSDEHWITGRVGGRASMCHSAGHCCP